MYWELPENTGFHEKPLVHSTSYPTPPITDVPGVCCPGELVWAVPMPSQGGVTPHLQCNEVRPKEVCLGQDSGFASPHSPHPMPAPRCTPPTPSLSPLCEARSLFVILHKSAAIKMHWSRTALGRDRLAFPGQRPASLHIQWGLFLKVNAFSLGEGKGLPLKQWGGGRERETTPPLFSFPLLL